MSGEWKSIDDHDDHEPYEVATVGIVLDKKHGGKRGHVSVTQSLTRDRFVDYITHIPKAMVVEQFDLYEIGTQDGTIHIDPTRSTNRGRVPEARRRKRSRRGAGTHRSR
jgi:hypothetical protein